MPCEMWPSSSRRIARRCRVSSAGVHQPAELADLALHVVDALGSHFPHDLAGLREVGVKTEEVEDVLLPASPRRGPVRRRAAQRQRRRSLPTRSAPCAVPRWSASSASASTGASVWNLVTADERGVLCSTVFLPRRKLFLQLDLAGLGGGRFFEHPLQVDKPDAYRQKNLPLAQRSCPTRTEN